MENWIQNNSGMFGKIIALVLFIFGILLIVGALKDWDWLYKADGHYQNNWSMGQVSRYMGRGPARVIGFIGGICITAMGAFLCYAAFFKAP